MDGSRRRGGRHSIKIDSFESIRKAKPKELERMEMERTNRPLTSPINELINRNNRSTSKKYLIIRGRDLRAKNNETRLE